MAAATVKEAIDTLMADIKTLAASAGGQKTAQEWEKDFLTRVNERVAKRFNKLTNNVNEDANTFLKLTKAEHVRLAAKGTGNAFDEFVKEQVAARNLVGDEE